MHVRALAASGVLSFDDFTLDLDPKTTVVVGPNGAGKSNLLRLPDLVTYGLVLAEHADADAHRVLERLLEARYRHIPDGPVRITLDLILSDPSERDLVTSFFQAAAITGLTRNWGGAENLAISRWALTEVASDRLSSLWEGRLTLDHPGHAGAPWRVSYEFTVAGTRYQWTLGHTPSPALLTRADPEPATVSQRALGPILLGKDVVHPPV
jgi:hypothetical protein